MSSNQRAGRWEPPEEIEVQAILGEVTLDFTQAELPPSGLIEIEALAVCGAVNIIVPDGAEVELEGTPFAGSIEQTAPKKGLGERVRELVTGKSDEAVPAPNPRSRRPYFSIEARAIGGSVTVTGR